MSQWQCPVCGGDKTYDYGDNAQGESQYGPCPFCTKEGRKLAHGFKVDLKKEVRMGTGGRK